MIDWFVLLAPLSLLCIVLLFSFVGCVARLPSAPCVVTATLRYEIQDIAEQPTVFFVWTIDGGEEESFAPPDPVPDPELPGINVFEHSIAGVRLGQWEMGCVCLNEALEGLGRASCRFSVQEYRVYSVSFELVRLDNGGFEVRTRIGGCPNDL